MTTVIIDTKTEEAKKMVELLKSTKYAKIINEKLPNKETLKAIDDVEKGRLKSYNSVEEMMAKLKKDSSV
ncbi:MAG: hypothetical protein IPL55_02695 [Saprospiraceae bacterium]|nr:hypothetical protein [Saprospiraceae bacterium]MBL0024762.1 hypothetical protein [Saprospiraceae bacterium]